MRCSCRRCGPGESVQEGGEECRVGWGESGFIDLALRTANWWRSARISMSLPVPLIGGTADEGDDAGQSRGKGVGVARWIILGVRAWRSPVANAGPRA